MTPNQLSQLLSYDPETGDLIRRSTMQPVYKEFRHGQYYVVSTAGRKYGLRKVIIALQTGQWPAPYEYKFVGSDPTDVRWCNFLRVKEGDMRRCNSCGELKHQSNFATAGRGARSFSAYCGLCNIDRVQTYSRRAAWKQKYGISQQDYDTQLELQGGGCAICGKTPEENKRMLAVDHCHTNGHNRALLCTMCNTGLGAFGDSPRRLLEAAKYILRHQKSEE